MSQYMDQNQDYYDYHTIMVDPSQTPLRIDKFLMNRVEKATRSKIQNGCKMGTVLVNDKPVKSNYKVKPNDAIKVVLPKPIDYEKQMLGEDIPLDIVYEDEHLLVLNKQAGLVVHPGIGNYSGTLVNGLIHHFKNNNLPVMAGNTADRPGLVHRIDKETTGLMVIAKSEEAMTGLAKQFFDHSIERSYVALVWGDIEDDAGTIEGHIGRHPTDRIQMYVYPEGEMGKHAVTHYEVLERLYYVTLVKCVLETGRTHQIRVHMKHKGHILFNDSRYGGDKIVKGTVFSKYKQFVENTFKVMPRQALHAKSLGFVHPITKEKLFFDSELPEDFANGLERWRGYTESRKSLS